MIDGQGIGALTLQSSKEAAFSEEDITSLQTIVNQLTIAVENARLSGQISQMQETIHKLRDQLNTAGLTPGA